MDHAILFIAISVCVFSVFPRMTVFIGRIEMEKKFTGQKEPAARGASILHEYCEGNCSFKTLLKELLLLIGGFLARIRVKEMESQNRKKDELKAVYLCSLFLGIGGVIVTYLSMFFISMLLFGIPLSIKQFGKFSSKFRRTKETLLSRRIFIQRNQAYVTVIAYSAALFYVNTRFIKYFVHYVFLSFLLLDIALNVYFITKPYRGQRLRYDICSSSIWVFLLLWSLRDISVYPFFEWAYSNTYDLFSIVALEALEEFDFILYMWRFVLISTLLSAIFAVRRRYSERRSRQLSHRGIRLHQKKKHFWKVVIFYLLETLLSMFLPLLALGYRVVQVEAAILVDLLITLDLPITLISMILVGALNLTMFIIDVREHQSILFA